METENIKQAGIDFEWDDDHVLPEVINPEVDFLFRRMTEITHKAVNPEPGEIILDVGCGKATDGVEVARKGAKVVGLEPSHIMISCSKETIEQSDSDMAIVHGIGEYLPFKPGSFDKVYCKGSLDHFLNPSDSVGQMSQMAKPDGEVIIAIANFESFGFKLGKAICYFREKLGGAKIEGKMVWDIPDDHTYRFEYSNLKSMAQTHLHVKQVRGVSLLFGLPWWGQFLSRSPHWFSEGILNILDLIARYNPRISDVIVLKGNPRKD